MPRIRSIKPEFFSSEQVSDCSPTARLLFIGLWGFCDDGGVHPASPLRLKMEVFPGDSFGAEEVQKMVDELVRVGLVEAYVVGDKEFWRVTGWHHQKIEKPTYTYPKSREFGEEAARRRRMLGESSTPESSRVESSRVESKGEERKDSCGEPASPPAPLKPRPKSAIVDPNSLSYPEFPCLPGASKRPSVWTLTPQLRAEFAETFPGVDIDQEGRKAVGWLKANLSKRKTFDGMRAFLNRWLENSQNRGGGHRPGGRVVDEI